MIFLKEQNAPSTHGPMGRRPVALPAPSQTTGRHEFSADAYAAHDAFGSSNREQGPRAAVEAPDLIPNAGHDARIARRFFAVPVSSRRARISLTSAIPPSRALATAGASASAFSSEGQ